MILSASWRGIRGPDPVPSPLSPPPLLPSSSSSLALGSPLQESQLSLGGQHCTGEPDEELAGAFPLFIRNAFLGQKQPKRARAQPCHSTDAVSMASCQWQVPALLRRARQPAPPPQPISLVHSSPFALGKDGLRWSWRPDKIHPACILVLRHWAELSSSAHTIPHLYPQTPACKALQPQLCRARPC